MPAPQADVLIVDDDREVTSVLEMYCENMGIFRNIIKAKDGVEASAKMANQKFAIILLDINMPKKTGVDIVGEFDADNPNSVESVIIISGELNKNNLTKVMAGGAKNFLVKPFDERAFIEKVAAVLKATNPEALRRD